MRDDWHHGAGVFRERERLGWEHDVERLVEFVGGLVAARTLDVACGTELLTRHLLGLVVGWIKARRG